MSALNLDVTPSFFFFFFFFFFFLSLLGLKSGLTCTRRVVAPRITWRTGTEPPPLSLNSGELNLLKLNKTTVVKIRQEPKMKAIAIFTLVIWCIGVESLPGVREKRE